MTARDAVWRDFVDERIEEIAKHNQYITGDMIIGDLERHGKGLSNYSPLGPALQAAQRKGIIERQPTTRKSKRPSTVWISKIYQGADFNGGNRG